MTGEQNEPLPMHDCKLSRSTSHVTAKQRVTTLVDIQNALCEAGHSFRVAYSYSAVNSAVVAIVKPFRLISRWGARQLLIQINLKTKSIPWACRRHSGRTAWRQWWGSRHCRQGAPTWSASWTAWAPVGTLPSEQQGQVKVMHLPTMLLPRSNGPPQNVCHLSCPQWSCSRRQL